MSDLYDKIDVAGKFAPAPAEGVAVDRAEQTSTGLDWAKRQTAPKPEEIKQMPPIMPVAN